MFKEEVSEIRAPLIADVEVRRQSEEWKRVLGALEMALEKGEEQVMNADAKTAIRAMRTAIRETLEHD